jgi:hypothetical protein
MEFRNAKPRKTRHKSIVCGVANAMDLRNLLIERHASDEPPRTRSRWLLGCWQALC